MMTRSLFRFAVLLLGAGLASAQTARQIVVLESSSPRYVAGQSIDAAQAITLAAGETLMIATEDARLVRLVGPHSGPAIGAAPDDSVARRALTQLIAADRPEVGGIGGVRGDDADEAPTDTRPGPWFVHAGRSGDQCALQGENALLWREDAQAAAALEIRVSLGEAAAQARWPAGEQRTAWPAALPPTDDTVYLLRADGAVRSLPVRLHLLPPALGAPGLATAAWLAARGCTDQARLALR
jgi:hypothetical protein